MFKFFKKEKKVAGPFVDFSTIPQDILRYILLWLDDDETIKRSNLVSKKWYQILSSDAFWQQKCVNCDYDIVFVEKLPVSNRNLSLNNI
jgi:hypothetical protein